ncbi:hypothetical protein Tco_1072178 [Tanacetum coccineum]
MSTAEAEYVSLSACCKQVIWMRTQLLDYGYRYNKIPIYCDSKSAIDISCNPVQHSRIKHINICYHFIKEHLEKGKIDVYFVRVEYQLADLFIKALLRERFKIVWVHMNRITENNMFGPSSKVSSQDKRCKQLKLVLHRHLCSARDATMPRSFLVDHSLNIMLKGQAADVPVVYL